MPGNSTLRGSAWVPMLSTELNALAPGVAALQNTATNAAYDNTSGGNLYTRMRIQIDIDYVSAPSLGRSIDFYIVPLGQDGSNRWSGGVGITPQAQWIARVLVVNTNAIQRLGVRNVPIGFENFILLVVNNTDQPFPATGTVVNIRPEADAYT